MDETTSAASGQPLGTPLAVLLQAAVCGLVEGGAVGAAAPCGLADRDLLAGLAGVERLGRLVDGMRVSFAAEVGDRSAPERGGEGLAGRLNFTSAVELVAAVTSVSKSTAGRRLRVGREVRPAVSVTGAPIPARFDHVGQALRSGVLGVDAAENIIRPLKDVAKTVGVGFTDELIAAEAQLVQQAQQQVGGFGFTADQVGQLAVRAAAHLDPDGAEPRYETLIQERGMVFGKMRSGNTRMTAVLTPEQAGMWKAIDSAVLSPRVGNTFDFGPDAGADSGADAGDGRKGGAECVNDGDAAGWDAFVAVENQPVDDRTVTQKRVDTFTEIIGRASGLPGMPNITGAAPTINLHATLTDVIEGRGVGWIDGIEEPVPANVIRQLMCHGDVVTTLKDDHGHVLRHNKTRRFFSPAQNRALAARDGGCVWKGCDRPPSFCESHHVNDWRDENHSPGKTDIENGALLCRFHHSRVHQSDWELVMLRGVPHLIPPDWVDPNRAPQRCTQQNDRLSTPTPYPTTPSRSPQFYDAE